MNGIVHAPADQELKAGTRALLTAAGGTSAAADLAKKNQRRLSEYQSRNTDDFMPVDVLARLIEVTRGLPGALDLLEALNRRAGGVFVALPDVDTVPIAKIAEACAAHAREHGEASARLFDALGDMKLEPHEIRRATREVREAVEAGMRLLALLDRIGGAEG